MAKEEKSLSADLPKLATLETLRVTRQCGSPGSEIKAQNLDIVELGEEVDTIGAILEWEQEMFDRCRSVRSAEFVLSMHGFKEHEANSLVDELRSVGFECIVSDPTNAETFYCALTRPV